MMMDGLIMAYGLLLHQVEGAKANTYKRLPNTNTLYDMQYSLVGENECLGPWSYECSCH
jgi:hypothetical protein